MMACHDDCHGVDGESRGTAPEGQENNTKPHHTEQTAIFHIDGPPSYVPDLSDQIPIFVL